MILSGREIKKRLGTDIIIDPFEDSRLGPNSYNLRLHSELLVYDAPVLDMKHNNPFKKMNIPEEGLVLQPGMLYLGRTIEYTKTNGYVPMLEGRSSIGRLGLFIHITAGFGDCAFILFAFMQAQKFVRFFTTPFKVNMIRMLVINIKTIPAYSQVCCIKILKKNHREKIYDLSFGCTISV
jgi:hypothetical protein